MFDLHLKQEAALFHKFYNIKLWYLQFHLVEQDFLIVSDVIDLIPEQLIAANDWNDVLLVHMSWNKVHVLYCIEKTQRMVQWRIQLLLSFFDCIQDRSEAGRIFFLSIKFTVRE